MIVSFKDKHTQKIWEQEVVLKILVQIQKVALRKLFMLHHAQDLVDLRVPPANRLEKLKNDRVGQHSIRINDQWRICFVWNQSNVHNVEIVDYH